MQLKDKDKKALAAMVLEYPIHDVLDALTEAINNQVDELVDMNAGHSGMVKEMTRVAHHLDIFSRG